MGRRHRSVEPQYLHKEGQAEPLSALGPRAFALLMIGIGLVALSLATLEHRRHLQALRAEYGTVPYSIATVVAALIALLGVVGLASVLLQA